MEKIVHYNIIKYLDFNNEKCKTDSPDVQIRKVNRLAKATQYRN